MFDQPPRMFFPLIRKNGNAVFIEIEMDRKKIHSITPEYIVIEAEKNSGAPTKYYEINKKLLFFHPLLPLSLSKT